MKSNLELKQVKCTDRAKLKELKAKIIVFFLFFILIDFLYSRIVGSTIYNVRKLARSASASKVS